MKKILMIVAVVALVVCAYFVGRTQGRSSGFEDGALWAYRSSDMAYGASAIALLQALERQDYTRVAAALDNDLDCVLVNVLTTDDYMKDLHLPREIRKQETVFRNARMNYGLDDTSDLRQFAAFRTNHPSQSRNPRILDAVTEFVAKYK